MTCMFPVPLKLFFLRVSVTINLFAKSCLSPTATCELYASRPPELGPNEYTERLVLVTKLLGQ
ncbi:hypothetical protein I79_003695 [Cricetulus griseus]|uniref:Secreted protein n=1 Tax=Cricetulus griseus TaxID=10029 RepID=G3H0N1_CRIGR|nr:hypothetical protein I79_003695 [Cricetulus griseus]